MLLQRVQLTHSACVSSSNQCRLFLTCLTRAWSCAAMRLDPGTPLAFLVCQYDTLFCAHIEAAI